MLPYYFLIAAPFLVSVLQFESQARQMISKKKNWPILLFFLIYFVLLACRHETVGLDTISYEKLFNSISNTAWSDLYNYRGSEFGYTILNKLVSAVGGNYRVFLVLSSAIIVIPLAKMYFEYSDNSMVSISIFLVLPMFIMLFSGTRQAIAMSIGVWSFYAAKNKRPIWFLLSVLLAFSFHQSAFILLLLYPAYHLKLRPIHLVTLIPAYVLSFFFREQIFLGLLPLLGDKYVERYSEINETGAVTMLILFAIFLAYAFIVPKGIEIDETTNGLRNFLVLAVFIQMFSTISTITMRINYYYLLFLPLLIPRITSRWTTVDKFIRNVANITMVVFFVLYYMIKAYTTDSLDIYPYIPFWN